MLYISNPYTSGQGLVKQISLLAMQDEKTRHFCSSRQDMNFDEATNRRGVTNTGDISDSVCKVKLATITTASVRVS